MDYTMYKPNGRAFVAGNGKQRRVANAPAVQAAINAGVLVVADVEPVTTPQPAPAAINEPKDTGK